MDNHELFAQNRLNRVNRIRARRARHSHVESDLHNQSKRRKVSSYFTQHSTVNQSGELETISSIFSPNIDSEIMIPPSTTQNDTSGHSVGSSSYQIAPNIATSSSYSIPVVTAINDMNASSLTLGCGDDLNHSSLSMVTNPMHAENLSSLNVNNAQKRIFFEPLDLGGLDFACRFCCARMWHQERIRNTGTLASPIFALCCKEGTIVLPSTKPTPAFLDSLLNYENRGTSSRFRDNIKLYNSMFQFIMFHLLNILFQFLPH